jgi:hypothetical protein
MQEVCRRLEDELWCKRVYDEIDDRQGWEALSKAKEFLKKLNS